MKMGNKAIRLEIKKLEGKLYDNFLRKRAKSSDFNRVFICYADEKVHLMEEPGRQSLYYNYQFLCEENTVEDPHGILEDSAIILTKGSSAFMDKYYQHKLCPKCFKYIKPSDIIRLEAKRKRQRGRTTISEAEDDNTYLLAKAEKLESEAQGLDDGSIQIYLSNVKL